MTLAELADVAEVERLALRPGDIVVVKIPWRISDEEATYVKAQTDEVFPDGQKVVVLDGGADIAVLRAEEEQS